MVGWVLGCHKSGTSLLCSILRNLSGAHREQPLGPDLPANLENPAGFHESASLVQVNERLLSWAGSSWDRPFVARPAWEDPNSLQLILGLRKSLSRHTTTVGWIDKDPRLCLTRDALSHLLLRDPAAIAVVRNPLAVAASLRRRSGFPLRKGAAIWMLYNLHLFNSHSPPPETVVLFDELVSPDEQVQMRVARNLAVFSASASGGMTTDAAIGSLAERALSELSTGQRADLVRSENRWPDRCDGALVDTLDDIWGSCRDIIRGDRHDELGSHLRNAWAMVSPILEPEVAIPLRGGFGHKVRKSVRSLRRRKSPRTRAGVLGRLTQTTRLLGSEGPNARGLFR